MRILRQLSVFTFRDLGKIEPMDNRMEFFRVVCSRNQVLPVAPIRLWLHRIDHLRFIRQVIIITCRIIHWWSLFGICLICVNVICVDIVGGSGLSVCIFTGRLSYGMIIERLLALSVAGALFCGLAGDFLAILAWSPLSSIQIDRGVISLRSIFI